MIPFGSILNDIQVRRANSIEVAPIEPGMDQSQAGQDRYGSILNDPRLAQAAAGQLAAAPDPQPVDVSRFGSVLNDPKVLRTAEIPQAQEGPSMAGQDRYGSVLNDAGVGRAAGMETPGAQVAGITLIKNGLNGGELAPGMHCRYDLSRYQMGCERLLNMIPLPGGGITKRPGLSYAGNVGEEGQAHSTGRLIPWVYSEDRQLMLVFMTNGSSTSVYYSNRDGKAAPRPTGCAIPHTGNEIFELTWCQIGKYVYLAHHLHKPGRLRIEPIGGDSSATSYTVAWEELEFDNTLMPWPSIASIESAGGSSNADPVELHYKVTAIDPETGEESIAGAPAGTAEMPPPQASGYHWVININTIEGVNEYRVYRKRGGEYGFIGRVLAPETSFEDYNYAPDTTDRPPEEQRFFTGQGDYPSLVFLHQQRLGFAATDNDPLTVWLSQAGNFNSFSAKMPPTDDDGMEVTLASSQGNRILWAQSDRTGLALGTEGAEWFVTGANGESTVSPSSVAFQAQTRYGTQTGLPPLRCNSSLLFVQRGGKCVRDLGYSFQADRYEAQDLTLLSHHLFRHNRIVSWAWQESPANILWCVLNSGKLAALTYMPEQEVVAWHRHETAGEFLSCASLDDSDGNSRVWFVVRRKSVQADGSVRIYHCIAMIDPLFEGLPTEWDNPGPRAVPLHRDGVYNQPFRALAIPCLPEAGLQNGGSTLAVKKINSIKARVINSAPFSCQVMSQNAEPTEVFAVPYPTPSANARLARLSFTEAADWPCNIGAGFRESPRLALIFDGPNPVTVLGLAIQMEVAELHGGQV